MESTDFQPSAQAQSPNLFLNIPFQIAQHPALKGKKSAKLVYGALKYHSRHKDRCRVRRSTLAKECGASLASVTRALKLFRELGLIQVLNVIKDNEYQSSWYVLKPLPEFSEVKEKLSTAQNDPTPAQNDSQKRSSLKETTEIHTYQVTSTGVQGEKEEEQPGMDVPEETPKKVPKKAKKEPTPQTETEREGKEQLETERGLNLKGRMLALLFDWNQTTARLTWRYVAETGLDSLNGLVEEAEKTDKDRPGGFLFHQMSAGKPYELEDNTYRFNPNRAA